MHIELIIDNDNELHYCLMLADTKVLHDNSVTLPYLIIWLEARLQNTGFTFKCALTVFTRSDITPSKVNRFG